MITGWTPEREREAEVENPFLQQKLRWGNGCCTQAGSHCPFRGKKNDREISFVPYFNSSVNFKSQVENFILGSVISTCLVPDHPHRPGSSELARPHCFISFLFVSLLCCFLSVAFSQPQLQAGSLPSFLVCSPIWP